MISVDGLTKIYDGPEGQIRAVDDLSLEISSETIVGILGPNGAGKTTLIKSILGLIVPTEGRVTIDGIDVQTNPAAAYARTGAMLEGARNVYWRLTVRENLRFFASLSGQSISDSRDRHDELLRWLGIEHKADTTVNELSRGMKQKVALASTLARGTDVVFLDEPTLGLDVESSLDLRRELQRMVELESMTVLLTSHDMEIINELCDRVVIMNDGAVIADDTVENLTGVLDSTTYEITVAGELSGEIQAEIERRYAVERWERTSGMNVQFDVTLSDGMEFYKLMELLHDTGQPIVSVETSTPDLESVFLDLINGGQSGPRDPNTNVSRAPGSDDDRGTTAEYADTRAPDRKGSK